MAELSREAADSLLDMTEEVDRLGMVVESVVTLVEEEAMEVME